MSAPKPVGWITPTGQLFPLHCYQPELNSRHDAHKADWEHVFRGEKLAVYVPLTPSMRANAEAFSTIGEQL